MRLAMQHPNTSALRADALFVSTLQRSDDPSTAQVRHIIAAAVREYGPQGCAERVAQEFGDHPETAVARMRWARALASEASTVQRRNPAHARMPAPVPRSAPA